MSASGVEPFERDAAAGGGYRYTTDAPLSSRLANRRISEASLAAADWRAKRVIDVGCGDGTYTAELLDMGSPDSIHGVDPAPTAIEAAEARGADERLSFAVGSAYELPHADREFDLAYLRGVLHHVDDPQAALAEAMRVAPLVVVVEPNGYNAGLKVLERVSPYHREHGERSYPPRRLDRWAAELGARVVTRSYVGFVPMFSPDRYAKAAKRLEPALESRRGLRETMCAQYVFTVESPPPPGSPREAPRADVPLPAGRQGL